MVCVIRRKGEHSRSLPRRKSIQWPRSTMETTEAGLGLVLLSLLFVIILVKYAFDSREQGPPLLRNQGAGGGSRGSRGLGNRSRCGVTLCRRLNEVHLGLFCSGFYDRSGWRGRRDVITIGECRGILSSLRRMIELRYCGV